MGKIYPEEVKRKAAELYRLDDDVTYAQVGRDLGGISGGTVRNLAPGSVREDLAPTTQGRGDRGAIDTGAPVCV